MRLGLHSRELLNTSPTLPNLTTTLHLPTTMPINFFRFPAEIRNKIYEELLVVSESITTTPYPHHCGAHTAILLTSKKAHHEARQVFYSQNRFKIESPPEVLSSFLIRIGLQNSNLIRGIKIAFIGSPDNLYIIRHKYVERRGSVLRALDVVKEYCAGVTGLEIWLQITDKRIFTIDVHGPRVAAELVDAPFEVISTLLKVIVHNLYDGTDSEYLREYIRGFGWMVEISEFE